MRRGLRRDGIGRHVTPPLSLDLGRMLIRFVTFAAILTSKHDKNYALIVDWMKLCVLSSSSSRRHFDGSLKQTWDMSWTQHTIHGRESVHS